MIQMSPPRVKRRRSYCLRLLVLLLPMAITVGCAGNDDKEDGAVATPTSAVVMTATPTSRPATPTSSPIVSTATPTSPGNVATATPTRPAQDIALAACQKLTACSQCFINDRGACLDAAQCATRLSEDEARCINAAAGCNAITLGDCLTVGCGGDGTGECD